MQKAGFLTTRLILSHDETICHVRGFATSLLKAQGYVFFFMLNSAEHETLSGWHFNIYEQDKFYAQLI